MVAFRVFGASGILLLLASLVVGDVLDGALEFGGDLISGSALAAFIGAFGFGGALALDASGSMGIAITSGVVAAAEGRR